jgi:hypothetical protein
MSSLSCIKTAKIGDVVEVSICQDNELGMYIVKLHVDNFSSEMLFKLGEHIKSCCGEEFKVAQIDGKTELTKVALASAGEADKTLLDMIMNSIISKLENCEVVKKVEEIRKEVEEKRRQAKKQTRTSRRKSS